MDIWRYTERLLPRWRLKDSVAIYRRTNRRTGDQNRVTIAIICIDLLPGLSRSLPCRSFTHSRLCWDGLCVFRRVCSDWKDSDNLERTMQHVCRCYQCFVQLDSAQSSTLWRPEMSMHYLWNHQLLYAGADVFDGYSFIRHQLSKRRYPVTIYALEGVTRALMRSFPFTLFAHKFRWISGMDSPTSSLSHFLLQCEEILKAGQILLIILLSTSHGSGPHVGLEQNNVDKYSKAKQPPWFGIWRRSRC